MKSLFSSTYLLGVLFSFPTCLQTQPDIDASNGSPWPMPHTYTVLTGMQFLDPSDFRFLSTGYSCDIIDEAFTRYFEIIFSRRKEQNTFHQFTAQLTVLYVNLQNVCEKYPTMSMDESCKFSDIPTNDI